MYLKMPCEFLRGLGQEGHPFDPQCTRVLAALSAALCHLRSPHHGLLWGLFRGFLSLKGPMKAHFGASTGS